MILKSNMILITFFFLSLFEYIASKNIYLHHKYLRGGTQKDLWQVRTESGVVQGRSVNFMIAFNGIPYAKPPIGKWRFEPPQKVDKWNGNWNATYDRNACVQTSTMDMIQFTIPKAPTGDEDCLYLNVYVPQKSKRGKSLSVMVWIHGGTFLTGDANYNSYGPDMFIQEGVIVVTIQYRLGIFGFLSTNDEVVPGNNGIRDQISALKWVQRNIRAFGGNPKKVTIFGQSAGGASVSYLVLSHLAKGLFKRAILQSGSALCPWSLSRKGKEAAYMVGKKLNISSTNSKDLVEQLKKVPANELQAVSISTMGEILMQDPLNGLVFAPVIEPPTDDSVITKYSYEALNEGDFNQVPQIIGYTSAEAISFESLLKLIESYLTIFNVVPSNLVPVNMNSRNTEAGLIGEKIKEFYSAPLGRRAFENINFLQFMSDNDFVRPIRKTAELTSLHTKTYLYKFSYATNPNARGVGHSEDLLYLFNSTINGDNDKLLKKCMIKLWTNFATFGEPTPSSESACGDVVWNPIKPNKKGEVDYINIDVKTVSDTNPDMENIQFWESIYKEYGNPPYKTY